MASRRTTRAQTNTNPAEVDSNRGVLPEDQGRAQDQGNDNLPNPPEHPTMAQVMAQQTQILQAIYAGQQGSSGGHRADLGDFQRTGPITFTSAEEPLEAEDWL